MVYLTNIRNAYSVYKKVNSNKQIDKLTIRLKHIEKQSWDN